MSPTNEGIWRIYANKDYLMEHLVDLRKKLKPLGFRSVGKKETAVPIDTICQIAVNSGSNFKETKEP
jgi:hypothetical protein